ncbi:amidohydrolase family protein [Halorussus halophilus]|uniref:amidohydrolase family protein n=1 Tax=Halorussus halophilus TaxID=2650975 RepID=UPI0013014A8B|nr:amidohydrolase family protein [Halorussus halophilus]
MLELEHRFRVVDVHARFNADAGGVQTRGRAISPDRLEREMHQAGVVRTVVFPGPRGEDSYVSANNAVARRSVERPFLAFARINGPRDPGGGASRLRNLTARRKEYHTTPEDIEQYAYDDRFHGFKLHPVEDGLPDEPVLDQLEEVGLPVLVHAGVGYPPSEVADTLLTRSFPVILAHFGGHPLDRDLMSEAVDLLERHDECYLDTSYVRYRDLLERAVMEHPDRVLFGSGAPSAHPNVAVMEILTLDVPEDAMRKVFDKNPCRVIPALSRDGR